MPPPPPSNLYEILRVNRAGSFDEIKRAYYKRAKECHPDLFDGDRGKEDEFKQVVGAFDVLSDPTARQAYDQHLARLDAPPQPASFRQNGPSIMDSIADDILEEMIVGNEIPRNTTLQTLMRDLTRTRRFVMFREGKYRFSNGETATAFRLFRSLLGWSPMNILYHYYYAESARRLGKFWRAYRHYRISLQLGLMRVPPQRLDHIRRRLDDLVRQRGSWGRLLVWLTPGAPPASVSVEDEVKIQLDRAFGRAYSRMLNKQAGSRNASRSLGHRLHKHQRLLK